MEKLVSSQNQVTYFKMAKRFVFRIITHLVLNLKALNFHCSPTKVMFSQVYVSHSVQGMVGISGNKSLQGGWIC